MLFSLILIICYSACTLAARLRCGLSFSPPEKRGDSCCKQQRSLKRTQRCVHEDADSCVTFFFVFFFFLREYAIRLEMKYRLFGVCMSLVSPPYLLLLPDSLCIRTLTTVECNRPAPSHHRPDGVTVLLQKQTRYFLLLPSWNTSLLLKSTQPKHPLYTPLHDRSQHLTHLSTKDTLHKKQHGYEVSRWCAFHGRDTERQGEGAPHTVLSLLQCRAAVQHSCYDLHDFRPPRAADGYRRGPLSLLGSVQGFLQCCAECT